MKLYSLYRNENREPIYGHGKIQELGWEKPTVFKTKKLGI